MEQEKVESGASKPKVTVDTILVNEIGQIGLYQVRVIALAALVGVFVSWSTNQFLFTAARINTRCLIPQCEIAGQTEFSPPWKEHAIPQISSGSFDNCQRFPFVNDTNISIETSEVCPSTLFNTSAVEACEDYVYESTDSVVYDYDLACDEWRRTLIGTLRTIGTLFALPFTGYISDRWGRRFAMVSSITFAAFVGVLRIFANTYTGFIISQFFEAFGFGGFSCSYIMAMEIVGTRYRVAAAASISSSFATGQVTLAAIAWAVPYWKHMTLVIYLPQFLVLSYLWFMPENARWYMSKGKYDEAEKVLEDAAKVNKRTLSQGSRNALRQIAEESKNKSMKLEKEPWLVTLVFRNKPILIRCIASPVWWISTMCVYYGLSINAVHLVGNSYVNYMVVAAVEIPGFWLAVLLMNGKGRRPVLLGGFWVCAACMLGYIFVSEDRHVLSLILYLICKCSISMVMVSIHLYTAELYPTTHRHSLFAFSSMMGRFGHILAPLTPAMSAEVWTELPFALFTGLAFISGAMVFLTPETVGVPLPDTIEQANNIGRRKPNDTQTDNKY